MHTHTETGRVWHVGGGTGTCLQVSVLALQYVMCAVWEVCGMVS